MRSWPKKLQFFGLVTLVALLVWLYAEGQNLRHVRQTVTIRFTTEKGYVISPQELNDVEITFQGTGERISRIRQRLDEAGALYIHVDPRGKTLGQRFDFRISDEIGRATFDRLGEGSRDTVSKLGVNVIGLEPGDVRVMLDKLESYPVKIELSTPGYDIKYNSNPETVNVIMPAKALVAAGITEEELVLRAEIPEARLAEAPRDEVQVQTVPIELPEALANNPQVELERQNVTLTFTVSGVDSSWEVKQVPVWVSMPPSEVARYAVTLEPDSQFIPNIVIKGSAELIDPFKNDPENYSVVVTVNLSAQGLASGNLNIAPVSMLEIRQRSITGAISNPVMIIPLNPNQANNAQTITPSGVVVEMEQTRVKLQVERQGG